MIISLSWLKQHLTTKANLSQIVERLTEIGLEVESIKSSNENLDNFIICKIIKSLKHPNADKLKLCEVDIGTKKIVNVVCGAENARNGLFTVYAPPGTVIPKTKMKLKIAKIRGIESNGMLCSGYELNQSSDKEGIIELNKKEKNLGEKYFNNTGDQIIDITITPNRADCLGVRGIARDLASSGLGVLKKQPPIRIKQKFKQPIKVSILKENNQGCAIFGSCYIKNVENKESPEWLKNKIISLGLKPISAIVDATNYVMFDLNRPLHAYDADKIDKELIVRNSKKNESFEALDNKKYILQNNMCAITDKTGVLGLGGIIGGTRSGTELSTKNILLESAYFYPSSVRKTSKNLNIDTDAKYRFERGIDPNSIRLGLELGMCMILDMCGGEASKFSIVDNLKGIKKTIDLDPKKFSKVIGIPISTGETKKILTSLGCDVKASKSKIKVITPTWRPDLKEDIDLIEELTRIKGYDKIKLIEPHRGRQNNTLNSKQKLINQTQRIVASKGYLQTVTWSFSDSKVDNLFAASGKEIKVSNPISSDLDVLRRSIFSNLAIGIKKNLDNNFSEPSLFEVGPIFYGKNPGEQEIILGALKTGVVFKKNWIEQERPIDIFDIKTEVVKSISELGLKEKDLVVSNKSRSYYHPGKSGSINMGSENGPLLSIFGEIHPAIIQKLDLKSNNLLGFEIFLKNFPQSFKKYREIKKQYNISNFQKTERDFAFIIDKKFNSNLLVNLIQKIDKILIHDVKVFDVYEGKNVPDDKKSIALNVTMQAYDKTLNEKDIEELCQKIINAIKNVTGGELRS